MRRFIPWIVLLTAGFCLFAATGCRQETAEVKKTFDLDGFMPVYNRYIERWLHQQVAATTALIEKNNTALATAEGEAKTTLEQKAKTLQRELDKWNFRLSVGGYFKVGDPKDIPADLSWEIGMNEDEVGDPAARKGGVLRR